jgi:hypothetical protein
VLLVSCGGWVGRSCLSLFSPASPRAGRLSRSLSPSPSSRRCSRRDARPAVPASRPVAASRPRPVPRRQGRGPLARRWRARASLLLPLARCRERAPARIACRGECDEEQRGQEEGGSTMMVVLLLGRQPASQVVRWRDFERPMRRRPAAVQGASCVGAARNALKTDARAHPALPRLPKHTVTRPRTSSQIIFLTFTTAMAVAQKIGAAAPHASGKGEGGVFSPARCPVSARALLLCPHWRARWACRY